jgi:transcriptional regulator with PAS, ATPase and Fis domain
MRSTLDSESYLGMQAIISSEPMRQLLKYVQRVAQTKAAVLITGESGSGKELVARAVHHYSLRCSKPWVDVSCAALPEHLIESELFGYEKGAFSGADTTKPGLLELAHTGTLFLDEIGDLEMKMQVKLLRVLDGVPYYRLGGTRKTHCDVRIVAATNQNLEEAVSAGRFRKDLFHRLDQVHIRVPSLRERGDDILPLADFFLAQQRPDLRISPGAQDALQRYHWPGNVRELRNAMVKAAIEAESEEILVSDLPVSILRRTNCSLEDSGSLDGMERRMILEVLSQTGGHHQRAADILGISRRTLSRKLRLYNMDEAPQDCLQ